MDTEPQGYESPRLFNHSNREITDEDNDVLLATMAARNFIRIRDHRVSVNLGLGRLVVAHGAKDTRVDTQRILVLEAEAQWTRVQEELMPFVRDGTISKTGFAHLADEMELMDWCPFEELPGIAPKTTVNQQLHQARAIAEKLRNELWRHVRKEGDPEKPTKKLPWEETES